MTAKISSITRGMVHPDYLWRCTKCKRTAAEGATPRYKRSPTRPESWCVECARAVNKARQANRRIKARGGHIVGLPADPEQLARLDALAVKWLGFAGDDDEWAAEVEDRDPWMAERLRDRAENWRALARQARTGEIA